MSARHAGQRFLIAENDFDSKRLFSMLMLFSALLDPNTSGSQPLITVPTG